MAKKRSPPKNVTRNIIVTISLLILLTLYIFRETVPLINGLSVVGLIIVFHIIDILFDLNFKKRHYFFIIFMAVTGIFLSPLYFIYPNYDKLQHFIIPIMFSSIIFYMVSRLKLKLKWALVFTFFIVVGFIGMFELGEYAFDVLFNFNLQGVFQKGSSGFDIILGKIDDTMIDMALGVLGALTYNLFTFFRKNKLNNSR